jgi:hypothetical protein
MNYSDEQVILAATDAETVHAQCEHAATTIQEKFRRAQRKLDLRKAWLLREEEETLENSSLRNGEKSSDELAEAIVEEDEKTESSEAEEVNRTELLMIVFVSMFSCVMIIYRTFSKLLSKSSDVDVTDVVNPNVVQSGGWGGGGGGGGGAIPPPP